MKRTLALIALIAGSAAAAPDTQPTTQTAASQPATSQPAFAQSHRMLDNYSVLMTRDIFMHGGQTVTESGPAASVAAPTEVTREENNLVFNGVTESDQSVALIEDTVNHSVQKMHVGDRIASGVITAISFDSIDYQNNGNVTHIPIGQTLAGGRPTITAAATSEPSTPPPGVNIPNGGYSSLLERMRRRRASGL